MEDLPDALNFPVTAWKIADTVNHADTVCKIRLTIL